MDRSDPFLVARLEMIDVLHEAVEFLVLPVNDFSWSSWANASAAIDELNAHITQWEAGDISALSDLKVLFALTGPLQETSLSSGWGEAYLRLAERFDAAEARLRA